MSDQPIKPRMTATIGPDKEIASLEFHEKMELSEAELLDLIRHLGKAHEAMLVGKELPRLENQQIEGIFDTRWFIDQQMMGEAVSLSFYHPSFGPVGFLVPIDQVRQMNEIFARMIAANDASKTQAN